MAAALAEIGPRPACATKSTMFPTSVIVLLPLVAASSAVTFVFHVPAGAGAAARVQPAGSLPRTEPRKAGFGRDAAPKAPNVTGPPAAEPGARYPPEH